ncbi:MAG: type II toxin-antitoxin system HicA family toxin [Microgenomates group bacterium]
MSKITPIHYRKFKKVFERAGWEYLGDVGDHMQFKRPGYIRRVVIPKKKDIPVFVIKNNLRTAKIDRKTYFKLLKKK